MTSISTTRLYNYKYGYLNAVSTQVLNIATRQYSSALAAILDLDKAMNGTNPLVSYN